MAYSIKQKDITEIDEKIRLQLKNEINDQTFKPSIKIQFNRLIIGFKLP